MSITPVIHPASCACRPGETVQHDPKFTQEGEEIMRKYEDEIIARKSAVDQGSEYVDRITQEWSERKGEKPAGGCSAK